MAARSGKIDFKNLPTGGVNGRFKFQFVYQGMNFVVRLLGKDAQGTRLFMEGHLGFVPFPYEGPDMRGQLLEVLQIAQRQKMVHINLVAEQRISLTAEIRVDGALNANSVVSAVAARIAAVKPLLDVIRMLQPYQRDYAQAAGPQTAA